MWLLAALAGAASVATGLLPWTAAVQVSLRVAPVLAFLVGITVLAELADAAEVFQVAANWTARRGRGRTRRLFLLVAALGTLTTVALSLDTTAVLLTPVVLTLAQGLELSPLPFALAAVWLANTASLLLPVSNLTNLLALAQLRTTTVAFAARMGLPELVAVSLTVAVLLVRFRGDLGGGYPVPGRHRVADRWLWRIGALCCLAVAPGVVAGLAPWTVALPAAGVLAAAFALRRPGALRPGLVPWRLVLLTEGLFLVVTAAGAHGLDHLLAGAAGGSGSAAGVLRTAVAGAAASNAVNNLPAFLALERAVPAGHADQLYGLLLGTNAGPLVLLYGSLATLLWRDRCRARGVRVGAAQFARLGLVLVALVVPAAWLALQVTA